MSYSTIGAISLNISFLLYVIHYFPQLIHNQRDGQLQQLSLNFHYLLGFCYLADLNYGYGLGLPWQYRLVSWVGVLCLIIQHFQLTKIYKHLRSFKWVSCLLALMTGMTFYALYTEFSPSYYSAMGYLAHVTGLFFFLPQIIKNYRQPAALSLSINFLLLDWICYFCDNVSAWSLAWPLPSKIGAFVGLILLSILILQWLVTSRRQNLEVFAHG